MKKISKNKKRNNSRLLPGAAIYIGLGANRASPLGAPANTLRGALRRLQTIGVAVKSTSNLYKTQPIGDNLGGEFINAVIGCHVSCLPEVLLARCKNLERIFGRKINPNARSVETATEPPEPRPLDLDILAYRRQIARPISGLARAAAPNRCLLPHPRMDSRRFVLAPLGEIAPDWIHPISGAPISLLRARSSGRIAVFALRPQPISRKNRKTTPKNRRNYGARHS